MIYLLSFILLICLTHIALPSVLNMQVAALEEYLSTNLHLSQSELDELRSHLNHDESVPSNTDEARAQRISTTYLNDNRSSMSTYYSIKSRLSFASSIVTNSTGRQSFLGATWPQSMSLTANSGFGPDGKPRSMGVKGTREGRDDKRFLPQVLGVGRTGKSPALVPAALIDAIRRQRRQSLLQREQNLAAAAAKAEEEKAIKNERAALAKLKDLELISMGLEQLPEPFLVLVCSSAHLPFDDSTPFQTPATSIGVHDTRGERIEDETYPWLPYNEGDVSCSFF